MPQTGKNPWLSHQLAARQERYAAAVPLQAGNFGDVNDASGNEERVGHGCLWGNGDGNTKFGGDQMRKFGTEAETSSGHIHAWDNFIAEGFGANARKIVNLGAHVCALIGWPSG
jgi:hypothetical protein